MKKEIYSFNRIRFTAEVKNIDHYAILNRAFNLRMLDMEKDEEKILFNFIQSIKLKGKFIKSQLYQDLFVSFINKEIEIIRKGRITSKMLNNALKSRQKR